MEEASGEEELDEEMSPEETAIFEQIDLQNMKLFLV